MGWDGTVIPEQSAYKSHRRAVLINLNTDVDVSNWFEFSLIFVKEYFNLSKKNISTFTNFWIIVEFGK